MKSVSGRAIALGLSIGIFSLAIATQPAFAHHAMGGRMPANFFEGFITGLAHPIIGFDHFAFIIAVGLFAALKPQKGWWIPVAFVIATLGGTGLHLLKLNIPFSEAFVAASIISVGLLFAANCTPALAGAIAFSALAGIFHGYAYGESIVGAEPTPLIAYLMGFAAIQLAIASGVCWGWRALQTKGSLTASSLRFVGLIFCAIGATFLAIG
ncbi:HupE/UreJ family protein [Oscillatoria sp. FACHB-1406]|uniref:HupE/UreJ family protein n=1 Tax=Oscillatoria sp. FACHB-1406 TaxID=2692846 RepID=UPI0018F01D9C|nr:HupE/UreJ family protein [Oscillatoria sp. FACHB-1406]